LVGWAGLDFLRGSKAVWRFFSMSARERFLLTLEALLLVELGESGTSDALELAAEMSVESEPVFFELAAEVSVGREAFFLELAAEVSAESESIFFAGAVSKNQAPGGVGMGDVGDDRGEEPMSSPHMMDLLLGVEGCGW
jgi:hypothetical protein